MAEGIVCGQVGANMPSYSNVDLTRAANKKIELNQTGTLDYFGCMIGDKVLELQIDYTRTCGATAPTITATTGNVIKFVSEGVGGFSYPEFDSTRDALRSTASTNQPTSDSGRAASPIRRINAGSAVSAFVFDSGLGYRC